MSHRGPEQIEAEIEAQREQLAATVDQLTAKLDVKARMTTDSGKPRPELLAAAGSLVAMTRRGHLVAAPPLTHPTHTRRPS